MNIVIVFTEPHDMQIDSYCEPLISALHSNKGLDSVKIKYDKMTIIYWSRPLSPFGHCDYIV